VEPSLKNADLARCCLQRIAMLPKLSYPRFRNKLQCRTAIMDYIERGDSARWFSTLYACRYWSSHLSEAPLSSKDLMDDMKRFCRHFVFPWRILMEIDAQSPERIQEAQEAELMAQEAEREQQEATRQAEQREKEAQEARKKAEKEARKARQMEQRRQRRERPDSKWGARLRKIKESVAVVGKTVGYLFMGYVLTILVVSCYALCFVLGVVALVLIAVVIVIPSIIVWMCSPEVMTPKQPHDVQRCIKQAELWVEVSISCPY